MRLLYFDCFTGISGDMCLGALIDAGVSSHLLERDLRKIPLQGWKMAISRENSYGITGTRVRIDIQEGHQPHRCISDIKDLILGSPLPEGVKDKSLGVFQRLAEAEGKVHEIPPEQVHFHEVGAVDSIIDVVGTSLALHYLGVDRVVCSPVPPGKGFTRCRHGLLPVPAPATAELLRGVPLAGRDVEGELVTPTGAAIATTFSSAFGSLPQIKVDTLGYGLGSVDLGMPNFLRVFLGVAASKRTAYHTETVLVIETNIDDMNPEFNGHVMQRLMENGALDVFISPAYMKKNRPGYLLTVLSRPEGKESLMKILFEETTTLGLRYREEHMAALNRRVEEINTPYGKVRVKYVLGHEGELLRAAPEYEDCRKFAREKGVPLRAVYEAALLVATSSFSQ